SGFFQAEDGIRDRNVTGVQTCALPIYVPTSDLDALLADDPSGQWVTVDIEATNTSSGPEYFEAGDQVLMDADGSMYSRDISATRSEERRVGKDWRTGRWR